MRFRSRETQFPGKRKLIKVDGNNLPIAGESPILVNIVGDEGTVYEEGTQITADNLNKGNWRDDDSVSFRVMGSSDLPYAKADETQIVTKANGETWIIPPSNSGGISKAIPAAGSAVKVGNIQTDVNFDSDPQIQINSKADLMAFDLASQNFSNHIANADNPHGVTKSQVGLGNADNTNDADKPVSTAQQTALNAKANLANGAMSDPIRIRTVSSLAEASSFVKTGETILCYITNTQAATPFPELLTDSPILLRVSRTRSNLVSYEASSVGSSNNTLHASKTEWTGQTGSWVRPKGWATIWTGSAARDVSVKELNYAVGDRLRVYFQYIWNPENATLYGETEFEVRSGYAFYTGCVMIQHANGPLLVGMCSVDTNTKYISNRSYGYTPNPAANATMVRIDKEICI